MPVAVEIADPAVSFNKAFSNLIHHHINIVVGQIIIMKRNVKTSYLKLAQMVGLTWPH